MNVFEFQDYRDAIRKRVKELAKNRPRFTLKALAEKIPLQYTYLSKTLNDSKTHLNEDHLFTLCRYLEFLPNELEFLFLLRARAISSDVFRQKFLDAQIHHLKNSNQLRANVQTPNLKLLSQEMAYLLDPLCIIVHVSLYIAEYRENPRRLLPMLGIKISRLKEILRKLQEAGFIELGADRETISVLKQNWIHFSTDHPLMRVHQQLLINLSTAQILKLDEKKKFNTMVTFSAAIDSFEEIKDKYVQFLKQVESIVSKSQDQRCYQMNFELFPWA